MAGKGWQRAGIAAAITAASVAGFAVAGLIFADPRNLNERTPFAAARAFGGAAVGRDAKAPQEIPPAGWWEILKRTAFLCVKNRLMAEAGAVTFYSLLAVFPALTALVSLYGLFADPAAIARLIDQASVIMPSGGVELLRGQLDALVKNSPKGLSLGVGIGLVAALWSANQGSKALFESLNVIYRETEKRSYPVFVAQAFVFTLGAICFALVAMAGIVALPDVLTRFGLSDVSTKLFRWLRWPVLLLIVAGFLASLYRIGPSREDPKWRWVTWGGGLAALSWIAVSLAFSWYVRHSTSFDHTYGSLGAIVGFMIWIWLSTLVALGGAQLNSEMEHQTSVDTTTGRAVALGRRGATQADTVA